MSVNHYTKIPSKLNNDSDVAEFKPEIDLTTRATNETNDPQNQYKASIKNKKRKSALLSQVYNPKSMSKFTTKMMSELTYQDIGCIGLSIIPPSFQMTP